MTQINRLSQITEVADNDILPIWDYDSKRTRGVLASTIKSYATDNEIVNAKIVNDHLILITKKGDEIDAGELPSHEGIHVEDSGVEAGQFTRLNFGDNLDVVVSDKVGVKATINAKPSIPPHLALDLAVYGDANASEWLALGNVCYSFENARIEDLKNTPVNSYDYSSDPSREFQVIHGIQTINSHLGKTYVTRSFYVDEVGRPKGYEKQGFIEDGTFNGCAWQPINGLVIEKDLPDGGIQSVPSAFLKMGGGLKTLFNGEKATLVSTSPFADVVDIFDSVTISSPEDNRTYSYGSSDTGDDHEFWLNLDPTDVPEGYSITVNVAPVSQSSLTVYTKKSKEIFAPVIPGSTIVIKRLPGTNVFNMFKSGGAAFAGIADAYADLNFEAWKDLPINNYFVSKGTYANIDDDVNGKEGQIFARVINTDVKDNPHAIIVHQYFIQSDDPTINGRVYQKTCRVKSEFATAPLKRVSGYGDPADGFVMKSGKQIHVTENATIRLDGDMTSTFSGKEHNIIQPGDSHIIIGSNQVPLDIQFRNNGGDVTLQRSGTTHTFAYEDNTIEEILAGEGITVTGDKRFPKVTATAGGSGADPSDGFTLKPNKQIRFDPTSKMMLQHDGGTHTLMDFAYDAGQSIYYTQFGDISTEFQIKTKNRPNVSEDAGGFWSIAYDEENHIPNTEWERSTQPRELTADELYQYIDFVFEPFGEGHVAHLVMPDRATWESKFWIPSVNDEKQYHLPSIEHWRMAFTMPKDNIATTENHRLRLSSKDNLTNFDQDGTDVITGIKGKRWVAFWAKPKESSPSGWSGWVMKFSPDDEDDFIPYTTYQAQGDVAYTGVPQNQETKIIDGVGYVNIDRQAPVLTSDDETDNLVLIQINAAETETELPTVRKILPGSGNKASGFSLCPDGTVAGEQILQIASGTYSLTTMTFAADADVGDKVYVDEDTGKLTLTYGDYVTGWVIEGGVVIDVDIFNSSAGLGNYVEKFSRAQLSKLEVAYSGKFGDERYYPPISLEQVVGSANSLLKHTSAFQLESYDRITGDKVADILSADKDGFDMLVQPKFNGQNLMPEGGDATFKSVNIDTAGSGQPNFTASIHQDNELHTVIDATRELRVNYKDVGTGTTTAVMGIDNNQAQFLVPIYQGNDAVALTKNVIEKYTRADTDYVQVAYQGKYDDGRVYYPATFSQDSNGWTFVKFTGYMEFTPRDKITGENKSSVLELRDNRVVHKQQPYFNDNKLAERTNSHITNSASLNDLIYTNGQSVSQWISDNPDYTPSELLDVIFDCKLLGMSNWVVSFTTSGNNYNGTFPTSYQQIELHKTGGSARNFMRAYNKESPTHYFAYYKEGQAPEWKVYAYQDDVASEIDSKIAADKAKGIWIGGVIKDTLNDDGHSGDQFDCGNPKHYIEFRKTNVEAEFFRVRQRTAVESLDVTVHLHPDSGLSKQKFRFTTSDGLYYEKNIRIGEKWRFYLRRGVYPYFELVNDGTISYVDEETFNAKSGYSALESGGGSTKTITYADNGKIIKVSNSTVKVEMLQGMNAEDKKHGYFKYINAKNSDVAFEWYDRNGTQVTSNVPSVCPADTVVEIFADYAKDQYVLTFGQSKVISSVGEEQVQQIVSKSFDSLLEPGEGTAPFSKHPLPNQQGYLSTYASVMYDDDDRLVIPRNAYDRSLMELFFEASKNTAYCTIPVATVELLMGRILRPEDIELGVALEQSTAITPGLYSATTPSNVPSTWAWNGKFIPLDTEEGERNDPNNPTVWLSQDGDYVYSEDEAGNKPKYDQMSISDLMSKDGQTWRHALRRGYIMKDGSFVFDAESPYYVFVIKISGYQTPQSKIHTVFFNRGGIKLYPDAISAYVDQEKIREQLDELSEGLAQGFIYAKEVSVG